MQELYIVGNSSYSIMMKKYVEQTKFGLVKGFLADEEYIDQRELENVPVTDTGKFLLDDNNRKYNLVLGIGYKNMGTLREQIFKRFINRGFHFVNYIHPTSIIAKDVQLGQGNNILEGTVIEVGCKIGDANLLFAGSVLGHESNLGDYNTLSLRAVTAGCVSIKNNCFLGVSSACKDHITLGNYVMLGAMAYAYKDIEDNKVVVPAKSSILEDKMSRDYL